MSSRCPASLSLLAWMRSRKEAGMMLTVVVLSCQIRLPHPLQAIGLVIQDALGP